MPSISRFLLEGAELLHQDCSTMDRVMSYLEDNLSTLHSNFSPDNFTRALDVIWIQLSDLLFQLVQTNLEVNLNSIKTTRRYNLLYLYFIYRKEDRLRSSPTCTSA
jgi:hypothetical protein